MRALALAVLCAAPLAAQFSFGVKAGRALIDPLRLHLRPAATYTPASGASVVGASGEFRLPFRLGVELDILRRPVAYEFSDLTLTSRIEGSVWEFPLLAKYRVRPGPVTPFVAGGLAWNRVSVGRNPGTLARETVTGTPLAGGLEGCFGPFCLTGEIRYTRWHEANFETAAGGFSNRNQVDLLVGLTF